MKTVRFLQTGDWQLGMTRRFFGEGVQERFSQDRFDAVRGLGKIAADKGCLFMAVCGDVFESNFVDRKTVARAMEALSSVPVPVVILPGNHDPLDSGSVYTSAAFLDNRPANVRVVDSAAPFEVAPGVEIAGVPWTAGKADRDLVAEALANLGPAGGARIMLAHGMLDRLSPDRCGAASISFAAASAAIGEGKITYLALGDRHSFTTFDDRAGIVYAGSPEATDYGEADSGCAAVAAIDGKRIEIERVATGRWRFVDLADVHANSAGEIEDLARRLAAMENKERTALKLRFKGSLSLTGKALLDETLERFADLFAALEVRGKELAVLPDNADFSDLALCGFAAGAVDLLRKSAMEEGAEAQKARDALGLLVRLKKSGGGR